MSEPAGLILLDRDGVLNSVVVDPEQGTIDSPLHPSQVSVAAAIPGALKRLENLGFILAICSNQPSAAKGKTTLKNLEQTHQRVLELVQTGGARIASSHLCFHRAEDHCQCRKPLPGLLNEAIQAHPVSSGRIWMVGDGVTDVEAGVAAGVKTAFLGPGKCDSCKVMENRGLKPDFRGSSLPEFVDFIEHWV